MLVLTPKPSQEVYINVPGRDPIVVLVVRTNADRVRLGVTAQSDVTIRRGEHLSPPPGALAGDDVPAELLDASLLDRAIGNDLLPGRD